MKKIWVILIIFFSYTVFVVRAYASSPYVLPYPSVMPGGIAYKIHLVWEKVMQYWYFGSFGQFEYNLKQSDKYLVEAKTLFEYKQYLLGYQALQKSDNYFKQSYPFLLKARNQGKDIFDKKKILSQASEKHIEVLIKIKNDTQDSVTWSPEKIAATYLNIGKKIGESISIRKIDL